MDSFESENESEYMQNDLDELEDTFHWYQKRAESEDKFAQYELAILYEEGSGTERNLEKAFYWYQKAAENGYGVAQFTIGCLYNDGKGTEKDLKKAFHWYQEAADNGNTNA